MAISGAAVATLTAGGFLIYTGIRNVNVREGLRDIVSGGPIKEGPKTPLIDSAMLEAAPKVSGSGIGGAATGGLTGAAGGSSDLGGRIVAAARKYIGVPYVFGGANPSGMDCSGLVQYVLRHDLGIDVPGNVRRVRDFVRWSGVTTVSRPPIAGDLICWDFVHMGIAVNAVEMIHAPTPGQKVKIAKIWWSPTPIIKRVKG